MENWKKNKRHNTSNEFSQIFPNVYLSRAVTPRADEFHTEGGTLN